MAIKKILITTILIPFVVLLILKAVFIIKSFISVKPPYFEYSMGEIFKEVSLEEAKNQMNFTVYEPKYIPKDMPMYKTAVRIKPENETPEINFYTPEFPGVKPGPLEGLRISQTTIDEDSDHSSERRIELKNGTVGWISSNSYDYKNENYKYIGISFEINNTNIWVGWFGKEVDQSEVMRVAESMVPEGL